MQVNDLKKPMTFAFYFMADVESWCSMKC